MLKTKRKPCAVAQDVWLGRRGFKSRGFVARQRAWKAAARATQPLSASARGPI